MYLHTPWGKVNITANLFGTFNVSNLIASLSCLLLQGFKLDLLADHVPKINAAPGRMEFFNDTKNLLPRIVIDYAHTPDALSCVLSAVKICRPNRLICVFGCGGDRDRAKRALMAKAVEEYADYGFVTNDNPRNEKPSSIIHEICEGFTESFLINNVFIIEDRKTAIISAIKYATNKDIIVVAGKGHELNQIIGNQKTAYSDIEAVKSLLR